jgi:hypothetical protein
MLHSMQCTHQRPVLHPFLSVASKLILVLQNPSLSQEESKNYNICLICIILYGIKMISVVYLFKCGASGCGLGRGCQSSSRGYQDTRAPS